MSDTQRVIIDNPDHDHWLFEYVPGFDEPAIRAMFQITTYRDRPEEADKWKRAFTWKVLEIMGEKAADALRFGIYPDPESISMVIIRSKLAMLASEAPWKPSATAEASQASETGKQSETRSDSL